ncbi:MAG: NADH-quinone oxidoreductase subunit J [Herbaspirillum sp.]
MEFKTFLFYAFALILVLAALRVVTDRNPVHAALFLVLSFFSTAAIWLLLRAEFLAIVLVLVYVGAVMVLFMFVVMMLDIDISKAREGFWSYLPLGSVIGVIIVLEMSAVLLHGFKLDLDVPAAAATIGDTRELGKVLYSQYIFAFEVAGVILLVAMVSAVALTIRRRKDRKYFSSSDAVKVRSVDRVRLVKMKSETVSVAESSAETDPAVPAPIKKL